PLRIVPVVISKVMRFRNYFHLDKFFYFINPFKWAPLVSFIGSDGSGKSTLVSETKNYLDALSIPSRKMSLGVFSSIKNPFKKKKPTDTYSGRVLGLSKEKSSIELLSRILMQIPNQIKVLYLRKKGIAVISDRYPYDIVNFYGARGVLKLLVNILFQKPSRCFYVKVSPKKLAERNDDLNPAAIKKVVATIESNKKYFSLIELKNEDFKKSKVELERHLSGVIKNV
nr:hypothetical protein [Bacteroidales bacterium]